MVQIGKLQDLKTLPERHDQNPQPTIADFFAKKTE
jgi:hypothetical protein